MAKEKETLPQAPEGFKKLATGHEGWIKVEEGKPITGTLVGMERRHDGDGFQYLLALGADHAGNKGTLAKGTIGALNESAKLSCLREYVASRAKVWILPLGKVALKKGSMWDFDVRIDPNAKPGPIPSIATGAKPSNTDADDIPF